MQNVRPEEIEKKIETRQDKKRKGKKMEHPKRLASHKAPMRVTYASFISHQFIMILAARLRSV